MTGEIRNKLEENELLLNNYLSEVFEVLNCADLQNASFFADSVCWAVLGDCYSILAPDSKRNKSKYFELVEKYISENPTDIKYCHAKAEFYASEILFKHIDIFSRDFIIHLENKFTRIDFSYLNNYYRLMSNLLGDETMEKLNDLICEAFFMCPPGVAFAGQILACCIGMFLYCDPYKRKQIFEMMLEEMCNE